MLHLQTLCTEPFPPSKAIGIPSALTFRSRMTPTSVCQVRVWLWLASVESKNTLSDVEEGTSQDKQSSDGTSMLTKIGVEESEPKILAPNLRASILIVQCGWAPLELAGMSSAKSTPK